MRVVIVEDDPGVANLLRVVLERDGHEVVVARNGATARRELAGRPPQLLILDRMLPDIDGADLVAGLRGDDRTARLPVLMLTADRAAAEMDDGTLTRILTKPFDLSDLRAALADLAPPPH